MDQEKENGEAGASTFVERLAQKFGAAAKASHIYGEPVERDGITVIPVAKAVYGFGGGAGKKTEEEGAGGGGGMVLTPVGYIEIQQGNSKFRSIRDPQTIVKIVAIGSLFTYLAAKSITSIFKRS
ncbi:GerW family sporulation protein [uncultured Pontibacter sp.]|uniref:GerW family sporulation protein n=1 Tax=uncultured Pontibacter sp. TaxID=453356 RepID=UPI0026232776|nr:GerW family sporulation protein [uncultured Pontibacter sp.]